MAPALGRIQGNDLKVGVIGDEVGDVISCQGAVYRGIWTPGVCSERGRNCGRSMLSAICSVAGWRASLRSLRRSTVSGAAGPGLTGNLLCCSLRAPARRNTTADRSFHSRLRLGPSIDGAAPWQSAWESACLCGCAWRRKTVSGRHTVRVTVALARLPVGSARARASSPVVASLSVLSRCLLLRLTSGPSYLQSDVRSRIDSGLQRGLCLVFTWGRLNLAEQRTETHVFS